MPTKKTATAAPKKYELVKTDTVKSWDGRTLYRIRAVAAIAALGIAIGDLGGYIEAEKNLAQVSGNARVSGNAWVYGDARVSGPYSIAVRSDGYTFILVPTKEDGSAPYVIAGCEYRTAADYRLHTDDYGLPAKKAETLLILDFLEAQAALEKWT